MVATPKEQILTSKKKSAARVTSVAVMDEQSEAAVDSAMSRQQYETPNFKTKGPHSFQVTSGEGGTVILRGIGDVRDEDLAELKNRKFDEIHVDRCNLTGAGFKFLKTTGVHLVSADKSFINDDGLKQLGQVKTVRSVFLRSTPITSDALKHILGLPITELHLKGTPIDDTALDTIAKMKNLDTLELGSTNTNVPLIAEKLKGLQHLDSLDLAKIKSCPGMEGIEKLSTVTYLKANHLRVNDAGLKRLSQMKSLSGLEVQYDHFTDSGLQYLAEVPHLVSLDVSHCSLCSQAGVERLRQAKPGLAIRNVQD